MNQKAQGYRIVSAWHCAKGISDRAMDRAEARFTEEAQICGRLDAETLKELGLKSKTVDAAVYPDGSVVLVSRDDGRNHSWVTEFRHDIMAISACLKRSAASLSASEIPI